MRYWKNKIFEDFFDDVDIDSDEMIDSEVEEIKPVNTYKEYSHSFGFDCPIVSQKISPVQSKPLLQLLSYIESSGIFRRYCLKIVLSSSIYKINQKENKIIKTFEFNPDGKISPKDFVNNYIDCVTRITNDMGIIHYHFTFDINTSVSFSKFVLFYINVSKLLSCVTRKQSLDQPLDFNYFIFGTVYDDRYRIFGENAWETEWKLTNPSRYCEVIDTFYKMFRDFGCSAHVSKKDIDKIREKWDYLYDVDYYLMLNHFELADYFDNSNIKIRNFGHFGNSNYITIDHKDLSDDADEPFNGTLRFISFKISQLDSLLSSGNDKNSLLVWTLLGQNTIINAIVDMIPNFDRNSARKYNLRFNSSISNALIKGLTEEQFIYFCEKVANDEMNVFIDDIVDIPVGETRVYSIEKWQPRDYKVYDNQKNDPKFSIKLTKSRKQGVLFSKLTLKRIHE